MPIFEGSSLKLLPAPRKRESVVSISTPFGANKRASRWLVLPHVECCAVVSGLMVSRKLSVLVGESGMVLQ